MIKYIKNLWFLFKDSCKFIRLGFRKNLSKAYFKAFVLHFQHNLSKFHHFLRQSLADYPILCKALHARTLGLHRLLPKSQDYTYSILIAADNPNPKLFQICLTSACMQTAPNQEILVGSKTEIPRNLQTQYPNIKWFDFSNDDKPTLNLLADKASGKFLLFLDQEDCLRPDLLFRYEQFLRTQSHPENTVISCAEGRMNESGHMLPAFPHHKKQRPCFPYIFQSLFDMRGLLIPKTLWDQTSGITEEYKGAEVDHLVLSLDLAGAYFDYIPLPLYYKYDKAKKQEIHSENFLKALKNYAQKKGLDWTFEPGYLDTSVRAIPKQQEHTIQVIIPFKDQRELTLRCLDSLIKQKGGSIKITAVDNGSQDSTIASKIEAFGEVLRIEEPFNYSRLNNFAVANTKTAKECDLILLLNNDVELDENALSEMVRWIDQPSVGMVGARLHYPNGMLQHGGVRLHEYFHSDEVSWEHIEKYRLFEKMEETKVHGVMDAVTAACALIKKENFLKVGGFDEIWYPIGFSDTSLAVKLKKMGLYSFYTPYAFGVHHESISRKYTLEDVEGSRWLHNLILKG